jgi:hypothetical protein
VVDRTPTESIKIVTQKGSNKPTYEYAEDGTTKLAGIFKSGTATAKFTFNGGVDSVSTYSVTRPQ